MSQDLSKKNRQQAARTARNRQIVNDYKVARGCLDCGYNAHGCALDFDHVRGNKKFNIGQRMSHSLADIMREIEKCDVVCSNCHRVRTLARKAR